MITKLWILFFRGYLDSLLSSKTRRRSSNPTSLFTTSTYNTLMDSCFNTVVHLEVKLWELVVLVSRSLLNITKGGSIYDVTDDETLDSLILGDSLSSGNASVGIKINVSIQLT